jgi:hypothetical protein
MKQDSSTGGSTARKTSAAATVDGRDRAIP